MTRATKDGASTGKREREKEGDRPTRRPPAPQDQALPREIGGPKGPEPTRYGDWEKGGRCSDF